MIEYTAHWIHCHLPRIKVTTSGERYFQPKRSESWDVETKLPEGLVTARGFGMPEPRANGCDDTVLDPQPFPKLNVAEHRGEIGLMTVRIVA